MAEAVEKNPAEEYTTEQLEETFERDLELFKKKIERLFSG